MNININSTNSTSDIPTCITKDIQIASQHDVHLQNLRMYKMEEWPANRNDAKQDI